MPDEEAGLGYGATGEVYRAALLNAIGEEGALYAIKLVDSDWRFMSDRAYCLEQLHDEYANYCLLQKASCDESIAKIIRRYTPICYGLYRSKDGEREMFLLITQLVPSRFSVTLPELGKAMKYVNDLFRAHPDNLRIYRYSVMEALLCLHSLGLFHCDAREENFLYDDASKAVKVIDFSESKWHDCPGLPVCRELIEIWRLMFGGVSSSPFRDSIIHQYSLPFINIEELLLGKSKEEREMYKKQLGGWLTSYSENSREEDA